MRVELNNGSGTLRRPPFDHEPFEGHLRCLQSSGHFLQRPVGHNTESTTDFFPNQRQRVSLPSVPSICSRTPCVEYSHRCVCLRNDRRPFQYIDNRHRALCQPCFFDGPVCLRSHSRNTGILTDLAASTQPHVATRDRVAGSRSVALPLMRTGPLKRWPAPRS